MRKARNKKLSLLIALVFAFTVIFPAGAAFAADEADFSSSYNYVSADKNQPAGTATVELDSNEMPTTTVTDSVYITVTLPEGVEFNSTPKAGAMGTFVTGSTTPGFTSSGSSYIKVWTQNTNNEVTFDFSVATLDIDKDFTGNLNVDVDVVGVAANNKILWTINDDLTIAKVAAGGITIKAGAAKKVSAGGDKKVAKITVEESKSDVIKSGSIITLTIETDDVEFSSGATNSLVGDGEDGIEVTAGKTVSGNIVLYNNDMTEAYFTVTNPSATFPGRIVFDPIGLNIAPKVDDEIEITVDVDNNGGDDEDETVTVATVGDVTIEVEDLEDNDNVVYAGQEKELDVEFTLATTDGSSFVDGDIITFELNKGKFAKTLMGMSNIKFYDEDKAFYYTINNDGDEIDFDDIAVNLKNDAEAGDITLTVGGDYGDLEEFVIATAAKPYTVTADKPSIMAEALGQEAGDITITEAAGGAMKTAELVYVELPSGVELTAKPKIEVTEGSGDAKIDGYGDDYFVIKVTKKSSSSKPTTYRVYNIKYDTGKLALAGDVELEFYGDDPANRDAGDDEYEFKDDSLMTTVINAAVVDGSVVTASFTVGDAGVAIQNGRTLVQVNTLCETLGLQKSWDETNKIAYFIKSGNVVAFPIGQNQIIINGNTLPVDQGGVIIDGYTYATLRGIQSAFGGDLTWDDETKTATFSFNK